MKKDQTKIVDVKHVPKSDHIVKFMKWEDDSAKSSFVIWNNREAPKVLFIDA